MRNSRCWTCFIGFVWRHSHPFSSPPLYSMRLFEHTVNVPWEKIRFANEAIVAIRQFRPSRFIFISTPVYIVQRRHECLKLIILDIVFSIDLVRVFCKFCVGQGPLLFPFSDFFAVRGIVAVIAVVLVDAAKCICAKVVWFGHAYL